MLNPSNIKPKILRSDLKRFHFSILRLSNMRLSRERNLIQPIFTMDHPRALSPKPRQHLRQLLSQVLAPHTDDLPRRARRVTQSAEQIERRVNPKLPSNARHARCRAMKERRKHETDPNVVEAGLRDTRRDAS